MVLTMLETTLGAILKQSVNTMLNNERNAMAKQSNSLFEIFPGEAFELDVEIFPM